VLYEVVRRFRAGEEELQPGTLLRDPGWRNTRTLLETGYIRLVEESAVRQEEDQLDEADLGQPYPTPKRSKRRSKKKRGE